MWSYSLKVLPASCLGSTLSKAWVLLKDPEVYPWGVVPRYFDPKNFPLASRVITTDFRLKNPHKNINNILGHTNT